MSFEVKEKDLLARIGRLKTKSGTIETPLLFPVINPVTQLISPKRILEDFGFTALITNAYILKKHFQDQPVEKGIHNFLGYNGVIMTDSGAYQILVYGDIEASPEEIIKYQEEIGTDIATILDWPTGWKVSREHAEKTVNETLHRAKQLFDLKTREDILWVGPVQGGTYIDLVIRSAIEMGKMPFQIYALGSPTEVMEHYCFDVLVDMVMAAKMHLPFDKPFHLFGAGHPFMFALAVALGCDFFDSAAYAIYAREDRYMTDSSTLRLNEIDYFPCACQNCSKKTPKQVLEMPKEKRQVLLSEHNLYVCLSELKRVKQAIKDGRLWEYLEMRAHGHPALFQALKKLKKYEEFIERHSPTIKRSGLFFFNSVGLIRPEVVRHRKKLAERYMPPRNVEILLLMPQTQSKPFHKAKEFKRNEKTIKKILKTELSKVHVCFYAAPFGVIPMELDEVYPLSQHEIALPLDEETKAYVAERVGDYINQTSYKGVMLVNVPDIWDNLILTACKKACKQKGIKFKALKIESLGRIEENNL
jgi:7-cyano-7-deazaguanine tRNA-ribosyltransferase